jgi:putative hydrolase of the HAD superfamily
MGEIRAIFFDVGGVLLTNGWDTTERHAVLAEFNLNSGDVEQFERLHPGPNDAWEKGEITVGEYLDKTLFTEPRDFTPAQFFAAMQAQSRVLPQGALPVLHAIAKSGIYKVAMLNNEATELNDYRIATFGLRDQFDVFCSSCYLGLRKPDPKIFERALQITQARPEESVFIDDRENNVAVANEAGMHGVRFTTPDALVKDLEAFGIRDISTT